MITDEKLKSMRTAGYLIEPPAGEVIASLVDEIFEYKQRIDKLESENARIAEMALDQAEQAIKRIAELETALQYERNFPSYVERRKIV